jgi:hypothetical protein
MRKAGKQEKRMGGGLDQFLCPSCFPAFLIQAHLHSPLCPGLATAGPWTSGLGPQKCPYLSSLGG